METTTIGGERVSRIGLGTWAIGGMEWGAVPERVATATILSALERGINLIDTAPIYGHGRSEELIGKAMREHGRREDFYIATKAGLDWGEDADRQESGRKAIVANLSRARLEAELERSLRRLGTEWIDLYQVHWPDPLVAVEETAEILAGFQRAGKVRALGVSNFSVEQMECFAAVAPLASNQPPYNLFERGVDAATLPWCAEHGVAVVCYSSLCRSLLGGRLRAGMEFDDIRRVDPKFQLPRFAQYLAAVKRLDGFARERYGKTVAELAVRWVLDRPGISVALWGAKSPEQLETAAGVMGWRLDAEAMAAIDGMVAECVTDPVGPEYLTPGTRS